MNSTIDLTPSKAWDPWRPTAADPWNRKWAAHLYRRAGFGAGREQLDAAEKLGHEAAIDLLLQGTPKSAAILPTLLDVGQVAAAREDGGDKLRDWWLYCMLQGEHPLREKLTLFWHNHFATSIAKVRGTNLMFRQNRTLRDHALGTFEPFLQAMSRDPAMLLWLDSNSNVKGKPNENYAREVMELFSLGVGNYKETDIREAARAFTGWHTDGKAFRFKAEVHDAGSKTFFGKTGHWNGNDIVKMILEQPSAARFLVGKIYSFFVSEIAPPDGLLEPLHQLFRKSDYNIATLMKTVLSSRWFFSDRAFRKRIKNPVEFVLGAVQTVYRDYGEGHESYQPLPQAVLTPRISAMAQTLFAPPNVKGWPGGKAWLNTSTLLERNNFASALASGTLWHEMYRHGQRMEDTIQGNQTIFIIEKPEPPARAFDPARVIADDAVNRPGQIVRTLIELYLPGGIRPEAESKLTAFLANGKPTGAALDIRVRELVHALMTMPEYQLC
ncbi:MAG TPA: DUF1800 domain-containing protein [Urbifossiella sp.]|jgi:hypothetical protein